MDLDLLLRVAGLAQLGIATANLFAPSRFGYRENLARMSPVVREIFVVHCVYIVVTVLFFAALCLSNPGEFRAQTPLGRALSGFLCGFWGLRLVIQLTVYDRELRRQAPLLDAIFTTTFAFLTVVFLFAFFR